MDVHRVRFIRHAPPSITCYAFSQSQDPQPGSPKDDLRLAIGRSDGSIEIWNPQNGAWSQETVFPPSGEDSVDSLVWTQDPTEYDFPGQLRLFSIGSSADVVEWDLATGLVKRRNTGNFGEAWCFAAQPRGTVEHAQAQDLVIGCGDGTIALLSTAEDDLQFKHYLARVSGKKARCLTITYQNSNVVVAGFADGTIHVLETSRGSTIRTMNFGAGLPGAPKTTLVWKVLSLPNGDLVSADSNGEIRLWDGKLYTMTQKIKGHDRDCLDLVASADGKVLFSGGVDDRIATYRATTVDRGRISWARTSHRRIRDNHGPVKALAAYDGAAMSVVLAAGNDPSPTAVPLRAFTKEGQRVLPFLPQSSKLSNASKARLVVSWWRSTVSIYRFRSITSEQAPGPAHQLVARINLDTKQHIRSASISTSGQLLAVSTNTEVKLFQLKLKSQNTQALAVRKVELPNALAKLGARLTAVSADEAWLAIVTPSNEVHVARIDSHSSKPNLLRVLEQSVELDLPSKETANSSLLGYNKTLNQLVFGSDSAALVVSDVAGNVSSWLLQGQLKLEAPSIASSVQLKANVDADSSDDDDDEIAFYGQTWRDNPAPNVPRLDSALSVLTFRPGQDQHILAMTARHQIYEFDLHSGRLTDWSRLHPTSTLPEDFNNTRDRVAGHMWDSAKRLWLYGSTFLIMLDLDRLPAQSQLMKKRAQPTSNVPSSKRHKLNGSVPSEYNIAGPGQMRKANTAGSSELIPNDQLDGEDAEDEDDFDFGLMRDADSMDHNGYPNGNHDTSSTRHSWRTYKYRPILGIAPIIGVDDTGGETVEMVVVEQPLLQKKTRS